MKSTNVKPKRRRRFTKSAKWALLTLTGIKDNLRALRPIIPLHREAELDAHLQVIEAQIDLVLDDEDMPEKVACLQLQNCTAFAQSLTGERR